MKSKVFLIALVLVLVTGLLLAACAEYVSSVEASASLAEQARQRLKAENLTNVRVETGDASRGWPQHAPYDAILITAAIAPEVVPEFLDQLD